MLFKGFFMASEQEKQKTVATVISRIDAILKEHIGDDDKDFLYPKILARLFDFDQRTRIKEISNENAKFEIESVNIDWAMDHYVAMKIGPTWPRLIALHKHLVETGATPEKPHPFKNSSDICSVAFADNETWKSMAFTRQSVTYMVVLQKSNSFVLDGEDYKEFENWETHIRVCTDGPNKQNPLRPDLSTLTFLNSPKAVCPNGSSPEANDYFKYKDIGDRGYLCSVIPSPFYVDEYTTKHSLNMIKHTEFIFRDLVFRCDCADDENLEAEMTKRPRPKM